MEGSWGEGVGGGGGMFAPKVTTKLSLSSSTLHQIKDVLGNWEPTTANIAVTATCRSWWGGGQVRGQIRTTLQTRLWSKLVQTCRDQHVAPIVSIDSTP